MSVSQPEEEDQDQESLKGMSQPIRFNEADPKDDQPKKIIAKAYSPADPWVLFCEITVKHVCLCSKIHKYLKYVKKIL